jgi:transcriptional regulator with PAS, ATPase and Fis domain
LEEKRKRIEITKILDSINSAVLIIDRDTDNIIKTNVTALKILECEADDILNKKRSDFIDNLHEQTIGFIIIVKGI